MNTVIINSPTPRQTTMSPENYKRYIDFQNCFSALILLSNENDAAFLSTNIQSAASTIIPRVIYKVKVKELEVEKASMAIKIFFQNTLEKIAQDIDLNLNKDMVELCKKIYYFRIHFLFSDRYEAYVRMPKTKF